MDTCSENNPVAPLYTDLSDLRPLLWEQVTRKNIMTMTWLLAVQRHFCPITALRFCQPESPTMAAPSKSDHEFDAEVVLKLFQGCKAENGDLSIDCYNDAYEELCKWVLIFFPLFSTCWYFSPVSSAIAYLLGYLLGLRVVDLHIAESGHRLETGYTH